MLLPWYGQVSDMILTCYCHGIDMLVPEYFERVCVCVRVFVFECVCVCGGVLVCVCSVLRAIDAGQDAASRVLPLWRRSRTMQRRVVHRIVL
jgi:hypothetical protein